MADLKNSVHTTGLVRQMSLTGLAATGICSMVGASINVVPFMIHRSVPGIGSYVIAAFLFAAIPAVLAAFAYAMLASAMPRAGGSYIYASRAISPYLGFIASFSQWFGLSIVIGAVSYVLVPFFRDIAIALNALKVAELLTSGLARVAIPLLILWTFVLVNVRGLKFYERTVIPMMFLMFGFGFIVIISGFMFSTEDFAVAARLKGEQVELTKTLPFNLNAFLSAAAVLFSSFIGFDSIAQAGGEARNPSRMLPLAIAIAILVVGAYYFLFTTAVYHTVPWSFAAQQAAVKDINAPGLLGYLLSPGWTVAIVAGAAISLLNDLPSMLLSVSRLMFAWAEDGIFPKSVAVIHARHHTPHRAIVASGMMATLGVLGCHFAGDFFLGVDIMVTSMLVNFLLMCLSVILIGWRNPALAKEIKVIRSRLWQLILACTGTLVLTVFLSIHLIRDISTTTKAWYFHSTAVWLIVMVFASLIFFSKFRELKKDGVNIRKLFSNLPPE